ncbi:hypothetical protein K2173_010983 [Erythroxylum novogranatense]|uniref:PUM-HD domain-containing protein n=1 Tax=Erythroxylum novogranatense TaxID=1862640 RepID=A0AAV8T0E0_9ROSI|nr:hypothetical protein K2173_010983 [Erythroxylum novogranatense]
MEDQRSEPECDEFERLLGEIPNATSENSHLEEAVPRRASLNGSLTATEKLHSNVSLDDRALLVNNALGSPTKMVQLEEETLPDDQLLTSAFAELNFGGASSLANCKSSPNHTVLLDCPYINSTKKFLSSTSSAVMIACPFQSANNVPHSFDEFNNAKASHENTILLKSDAQELKQMSVSYCHPQPVESFSTALPIARGVQSFQFLPNLAVPGIDYPLMSEQQQYFPDLQPGIPYLHAQQLNQPHIRCRNIKDEQYHKMQQQLLYMQQLHNQRLEAHHHIQATDDFATSISNQNIRQLSQMPMSQQSQQRNQEPYWNSYAATTGLNLTPRAVHIVDKVGNQIFPEKILTRSQGLNTVKAVKLDAPEGNESLLHLIQNDKVLSNGHLCHNLPPPNAGCFQLGRLSSYNLSPEITSHKNGSSWPQPQKYNTVDEVTGKIYLMAKDQNGCRFLQRKFLEGTMEEIQKIFLEIIDHIVELMVDPFGNYLVQKLLEVCDEDQRMQILCTITRKPGDLIKISCDMHGTRAVQKVIETLKTAEQCSIIVSSLKPGIVTLIKNMNGNHVAQRCLQYLMPEYREFLFEATTTNCVELATDRHGCCVLQKCLGHSDGEQRCRLVCEIISNALILSQDPFGNYVVQFVLELQLPWATEDILHQLEGNYGDLSMQKYSSNVVEKCLKYAGDLSRARIIGELINNRRLDQVMQDPYGNYVVQAALQLSKGPLHDALVDTIKSLVPVLRTSPYGKKVLSSNSLKK